MPPTAPDKLQAASSEAFIYNFFIILPPLEMPPIIGRHFYRNMSMELIDWIMDLSFFIADDRGPGFYVIENCLRQIEGGVNASMGPVPFIYLSSERGSPVCVV